MTLRRKGRPPQRDLLIHCYELRAADFRDRVRPGDEGQITGADLQRARHEVRKKKHTHSYTCTHTLYTDRIVPNVQRVELTLASLKPNTNPDNFWLEFTHTRGARSPQSMDFSS